MDREQALIDAFAELVKIVSRMQDTIKTVNECIALLKERVENLESRV